MPAPGRCTSLQRKFTPPPDPTDLTGGEEYVSLPFCASASFAGKAVCPQDCSDALFWEREPKFLFQTKALQII